MKSCVLLLFIAFLYANSVFAEEPMKLTKDVLEILNHTVGRGPEGKLRLELDKAELLYELTETNQRIDCMKFHGSVPQKDQKLLSQVERGEAKFDLTYPGLDLSKFEPGLVHLSKGQSRILIMRGELDGELVYFRLEIIEGKKGILSYVKIKPSKKAEERFKIEPILKNDESSDLNKVGYKGKSKVIGVKGTNELGDSGSEINWSVEKESSKAELVIKTDENPDKIILGLNRKGPDSNELSAGFEKKLGVLEVKGKTSLKTQSRPVHSGEVKIGDDKASLSADLELGENSTKTGVTAKKKLGNLDLEGKYSGVAENGEYDVSTGVAYKIDERQKVLLEVGVNEKSEESVHLSYGHTSKDKKTKVEVIAKAIIVKEEEIELETKLKVTKELKDAKDKVSISVAPKLDTSGAVKAIVIETGWDHKISENGEVGIFASSSISPIEDSQEVHDIGIKAKFKFGGPNKEIKILSVYQLYKTQIKENNGTYKAAYYLVYKYRCNLKTKKLKIEKPRKKLFGGYNLKHLPMTAMPVDAVPVSEYTLPKGVDKNQFCK